MSQLPQENQAETECSELERLKSENSELLNELEDAYLQLNTAIELSKRINRPKNNRPNGVWGLKLRQRKPMKKLNK